MEPHHETYVNQRLIDSRTLFGDPKAGVPGLVPLSNMHATRLEAKNPPEFPRRLQLSPRRVAWVLQEILDWIESRPRGTLPQPTSRWPAQDT
jgi:predicted DNA-binding transcriptional regulator AlpA